jgi:hypothetical protein
LDERPEEDPPRFLDPERLEFPLLPRDERLPEDMAMMALLVKAPRAELLLSPTDATPPSMQQSSSRVD